MSRQGPLKIGGYAAALIAALIVAGCGNDASKTTTSRYFRSVAKSVGHDMMWWKKPGTPAPQTDPEGMARSALALNQVPLVLATMEKTGYVNAFGMVGENGAMRTYFSPQKDALILRDGILVGTRGFASDLESADIGGTARLIHSARNGRGQKELGLLEGDGAEHPLPLECTVTAGKPARYSFAGTTWSGTHVSEHCTGNGADITNSYVVARNGTIVGSRQWISPNLGYITIQLLRR